MLEFSIGTPRNPNFPLSLQIDAQLELMKVAQEYGFSYAGAGGHHWISHPQLFLELMPMMGYVAAKLPGMGISGFIVLPLYNPVEMAEHVATVDHLCKGKFVLQVGVGWRAEEFAAIGTNVKFRTSRFEESIALMKQLWTGEEVTFKGRHFQVEKARMAYTPLQKPHPPIWIGAQSEGAIRRAARIGDAPYVPFQVGYPDLVKLMAAYRDELKKVGKPYPKRLPLLRFLSVDNDGDKARERARAIARYFEWYGSSPYFTKIRLDYSFEDEVKLRTIAGTPSEVVHTLQKYIDEFGYTHFSFAVLWPSAEPEAVKAHIALLGEKVVAPLRTHSMVTR